MPVLTSQKRKLLEDACTKGRRAAEQAVRAALTALTVSAERPPSHLSEGDRRLRRGLRAKSRQLGDEGGDLDLLIAECAYEQWHRLLFARFLAENNLLIHPKYRAAVTLDDCEELAASLGEPDGWSVAARFAAEILPGIFRLDDPCGQLRLAPEGRLSLESLLEVLPVEVFVADDAIGWVYQFWQKDKKDEVNAAERKIGGPDLGPVTQLFTENYMVRFLLENSLGAWWAAGHPDSPLVKGFDYLRVQDHGRPAAGAFDSWPKRVSDVTVMDPCCGSGHFLVEAFSMLWQMRAEEEGLSPADAQDAVLRDSLFGLELDPRCVQIAMFAVALNAWKAGGGWRELPVPNIACSGIPVNSPVTEWEALAGGDQAVEKALIRLHILFREADTLGSLINPRRVAELADPTGLQKSIEDVDWTNVAPLLAKAVQAESKDPATAVLGADAAGIARAADYLSREYCLVVTNVPYLGRTKQSPKLATFLDTHYAEGRADIAVAFLMRLAELAQHGVFAFVAPQAWMFLRSYEAYRRQLLQSSCPRVVARLGAGAFGAISGEVVNVSLGIVGCGRTKPVLIGFLDAEEPKGPNEKSSALRTAEITYAQQASQLSNPMAILSGSALGSESLVGQIAVSYQGTSTGDAPRFIRKFWEVTPIGPDWRFQQGTTSESRLYSGRQNIVLWEDRKGALQRAHERGWGAIRGEAAWNRAGIALSQMGSMPCTLYTGDLFDNSSTAVIPNRSEDIAALYLFFQSEEFRSALRIVSPKMSVEVATVQAVPVRIDHWRQAAAERFPDGLLEPFSDDPTQWLFHGRPEVSVSPLHVAVAHLVGYRWPEQRQSDDLDVFADADGVVCLPSVTGEPPATDRLQQVLAAAFGPTWSLAKQIELVEATGSKKNNLADWLRADFFRQHCGLFGNRPFIWHVWDGQRDGFAALVNYHRLDRKTLEKLTYTYLGDWIERLKAQVRDEVAGSEVRLAAASTLRRSLDLILEGEPPYDIYARWKSLAQQPVGWDPDINDGVRVNVRPFVEAGVLRSSFNIHWRKDRGKNPDGSERINDRHITNAEKRAARGGSA